MKYVPFTKGIYSTSPALASMAKAEQAADRLVFQIDDRYTDYLANKRSCRTENINKYYCENRLSGITAACVNRYIVSQLVTEHPAYFNLQDENGSYTLVNKLSEETLRWENDWLATSSKAYLNLFDGLCSQLQEDLAICQLDEVRDWVSAIHLCAPNHWAPDEKIGKSFGAIHEVVPGMEKTMNNYFDMLLSIVNKGPFSRFAWGIATDMRLNHHPEPPPGIEPDIWKGRKFEDGNASVYVRVERQNLIGFPEVNAFLFTIRTYFYDTELLEKSERTALLAAIESISPESLDYKGLSGKKEILKKKLS